MTTSSELLFLNEIIVPIRWVDIDAYGHLNNSRYFDAMTEVRAHYILPIAHLAPDCQFVLIHTDCNFKKPYYYPGQIQIQQFLKNLGKTSIELYYRFYSNSSISTHESQFAAPIMEKQNGILHAEGHATIVCFDACQKKTIKVPESIRAQLSIH